MASSPQKNLQFISPPKEAGDFLQNQVKGHLLQTTNSVLQTNHSLPQFAAEFFFQVFDDGVDRGLDVGVGQGPFFGTED